MAEVCFVTCARLPDLDPDDRLAIEPLAALGCATTPAAWDDRAVDWDRFDLTVIRSTWDYTDRRDAFVTWARSVPRLHNPAAVVEWNTDKRYLADLVAAGLPVVPTAWIEPGNQLDLPTTGEYVVKPSIGAGSMDADRYDLGDADARHGAVAHAERLMAAGKTVMVQPYAHAIEKLGETAVILVDGEFSHAIRKGPMLGPKPLDAVDGLYKEEHIEAGVATSAEMDLARAVVEEAAVRARSADVPLLYARVDMVPDEHGQPMLMELEMTEPSLFMATAPTTAQAFARAIATRALTAAAART